LQSLNTLKWARPPGGCKNLPPPPKNAPMHRHLPRHQLPVYDA